MTGHAEFERNGLASPPSVRLVQVKLPPEGMDLDLIGRAFLGRDEGDEERRRAQSAATKAELDAAFAELLAEYEAEKAPGTPVPEPQPEARGEPQLGGGIPDLAATEFAHPGPSLVDDTLTDMSWADAPMRWIMPFRNFVSL